jgi:uncharacterized protein
MKKHSMAGAIFENWCIAEVRKNRFSDGEKSGVFFFRDNLGNEIDLIIEKETGPLAVEIKSTMKPDRAVLKGLQFWKKYQPASSGILLYQGKSLPTEFSQINFHSWENIDAVK